MAKQRPDITKMLEEDKAKRKEGRESFRTKILEAAKEYEGEGSPIRANLLKAAEWMMPEPDADPDLAAIAGTLGGPAGKVAKAGAKAASKAAAKRAAVEASEKRTADVIEMLKSRGVRIDDTIAKSPQARQRYIDTLASKNQTGLDEAQKLADKFAPTTKRNITDVRVEGKSFSPEVREHAAKRAAGQGGPKNVKVAEEIDYSGLVPKVKPRK